MTFVDEPTRTRSAYARRWSDEAPAPHPAPEVACRLAERGEIPLSARRMESAAEFAGWSVVATYARGTTVGRVPRVVDSVALRMRRGEHRAAAVWLDGKFSCAFHWGTDVQLRSLGMRELVAWLGRAS